MKTANNGSRLPARIPRLPEVPRARCEGIAHLALGLAALAMVWLLQAAILDFVPRAGTFLSRVRETPEMLVAPAHALRLAATNHEIQAVLTTVPSEVKPAQAATKLVECCDPAI